MTTGDIRGVCYTFTREPTDASEVRCPACGVFAPLAEWTRAESYCEDCDTHTAMRCPRCGMLHDSVFGPTLDVRDGEGK